MIPQSLQKHFTAPVLHCKKLVKVQEGRRIRETAWKILREFQAQGFFFTVLLERSKQLQNL